MPAELRRLFVDSPVARLATVSAAGVPHLVPMVFAVVDSGLIGSGLVDSVIYSAVDGKPKTTTKLRRLANIAATGRVSVIVDHYADDWNTLWWVRADGVGRIIEADSEEGRLAISALLAKYSQYEKMVPAGQVVAIDVRSWRSWSAILPGERPGT